VTKSELIGAIVAAQPQLRVVDVELIVDTILSGITDALSRGDRVELRGFGRFEIRRRPAREGRNPRTGMSVDVPAKLVLHFRAGRKLAKRVNGGMPVRPRAGRVAADVG
jgi:integration host factor subunit beta